MIAALQDLALVDNNNLGGGPHRRKSMRYQYRHLVAASRAEMFEHFRLRRGVHGGCRFVEHQDIGITAHEGTRQRDFLPLATGQFPAALKPASELRIVAVRHLFYEWRGKSGCCSSLPAFLVVDIAHIAGTDILANGKLVAAEVLEDDTDATP